MAAAHAAPAAAAAALAAFSADARARAEREDLLRFQLGELEAARPGAGRGRDAGAPSASGCAAPSASSRRPRGGEETLYAGDGAVGERIAAVLRELAPLAALDPALAPLVERLAEARGDDRGRRARSRPLRARRPLRSGAPGRDRGAAVPAVAPLPQARRHAWPIWPRGARRWRAELAEIGSLRRGAGRAPGGGRRRPTARARGGGRGAVAVAPARRPRSLETQGRRDAARARLRVRAPAGRRSRRASSARRAPIASASCSRPTRASRRARWRKIASGGELSRVMLAVKQALARTDQVLTYVFDEVDAGVGRRRRRGDRAQAQAHRRRPAGHRHHAPAAGRGVRRRARARQQDRRAAARRASRSSRCGEASAPARSRACWRGATPSAAGRRPRRRDAARPRRGPARTRTEESGVRRNRWQNGGRGFETPNTSAAGRRRHRLRQGRAGGAHPPPSLRGRPGRGGRGCSRSTEGRPITGEVISMRRREDLPFLFDVKTELDGSGPRGPSSDAAHERGRPRSRPTPIARDGTRSGDDRRKGSDPRRRQLISAR